jgi:ferredoxin
MIQGFFLKTRDGSVHQVAGREGIALMEIIRDAGFHELAAVCGGCLSCATCHVYVEAPCGVAGPGCDEDALLDCSDVRQPNSRLSCQIPYSGALAGISVTIAPDE